MNKSPYAATSRPVRTESPSFAPIYFDASTLDEEQIESLLAEQPIVFGLGRVPGDHKDAVVYLPSDVTIPQLHSWPATSGDVFYIVTTTPTAEFVTNSLAHIIPPSTAIRGRSPTASVHSCLEGESQTLATDSAPPPPDEGADRRASKRPRIETPPPEDEEIVPETVPPSPSLSLAHIPTNPPLPNDIDHTYRDIRTCRPIRPQTLTSPTPSEWELDARLELPGPSRRLEDADISSIVATYSSSPTSYFCGAAMSGPSDPSTSRYRPSRSRSYSPTQRPASSPGPSIRRPSFARRTGGPPVHAYHQEDVMSDHPDASPMTEEQFDAFLERLEHVESLLLEHSVNARRGTTAVRNSIKKIQESLESFQNDVWETVRRCQMHGLIPQHRRADSDDL
ncbi:hypothetical protein PUNSTDRAFT_138697 [Punctularia strigosozonata HHB-11173 SS5]|uniref:Uncharacterized protein n=1 Tax=Punctularia strigosozonata (strain HHB-11173) TaxID=741275 RepID=R7S3D6_PUNST|nr:uncharacterized protein PUNSTDRAFT_138697 [Punctularia strigosozonata HHB-11173 SS5]EIN04302.1 hypothetical protein PUNSTDRAFT_138697 [Punctularia strigosozonata HHB-11173 SS5]